MISDSSPTSDDFQRSTPCQRRDARSRYGVPPVSMRTMARFEVSLIDGTRRFLVAFWLTARTSLPTPAEYEEPRAQSSPPPSSVWTVTLNSKTRIKSCSNALASAHDSSNNQPSIRSTITPIAHPGVWHMRLCSRPLARQEILCTISLFMHLLCSIGVTA